jgi:hypothetical protein
MSSGVTTEFLSALRPFVDTSGILRRIVPLFTFAFKYAFQLTPCGLDHDPEFDVGGLFAGRGDILHVLGSLNHRASSFRSSAVAFNPLFGNEDDGVGVFFAF